MKQLIWLTGLSGSGKTSIANALKPLLANGYILDGDVLRKGINQDLQFSEEDRIEAGRRMGEIAKILLDANHHVIVASISPYRATRNKVRSLVGESFIEVYVQCPLEVCEQRDPKGLYRKARSGEIKHFTGIDSPYEEPLDPDVIVETNKLSLGRCVAKIMELVVN
ncbi:putative adenylyl-sulfate kinase [Paenibacillus plantiphilus]|uniref:Adenylyl-sulfate kinase n=1 Tax=Paenibacillus plantiphilus TaxID=2905650 RepID=A0ABN8G6S5_9BACL|nr:adenylyl-sulfate kinase [Paenibacillus plantiphilus]CAH1201531.1 putative adenylyl-sulfate kinase [Paenibacillus plantiphilus]